MKPSNYYFKGFTLVELIIVITILAILSTIAFVSFQGYTKTSRDSNRLASLRNIESGLNIFQTTSQKYLKPDNFINIYSSGGILLGNQGYIGDNVSIALNLNKTPLDPLDYTKYIYSVNATQNKFQLLGLFENNDLALNIIKKAYALDNSSRIPKTLGNNIGIFLDINNNPIITDITSTGTIQMKVILSNNTQITGTGGVVEKLKSTYNFGKINWSYYDPNCDLDDIIIGTQIWAPCNSTIGNGMEWGQTGSDIGSNNYNGIISSCYDYNGNSISTTNCNPTNANMKSNSKAISFFNSLNSSGININGDTEYDAIWGKYYVRNDLNQNCKGGDFSGSLSNSGCPCPSGRHVPTDDELTTLENYVNGGICRTNFIGYQCSGLGWKNNGSSNSRKLGNILKWPMSGYNESGVSYNRGVSAQIWTSTSNGSNAYIRTLNYGNDGINRNNGASKTTRGHIVRCMKD